MESFILDQDDLENPMLETASKLLLSGTADGADLRTVDPETQARLEALLEAAGKSANSIYIISLPNFPKFIWLKNSSYYKGMILDI